MAFSNLKCDRCGRTLANSKYTKGELTLCPICVLGKKEGSQAKYWETNTTKNAGHPEGFRYSDDTSKYKYNWDKTEQKWLDKDRKERPVVEPKQ